MPNLDILNGEIASLESKTLTYPIAERLAWLYIVRDHCCMGQQPVVNIASEPVDTHIEYTSDTDFSRAIHGRKCADIWPVMDELMSTIQALMPRLYDNVMQKL